MMERWNERILVPAGVMITEVDCLHRFDGGVVVS